MEHSTSSAQTVTPTAAPALRAQLEQLQRLYRLSQEIVQAPTIEAILDEALSAICAVLSVPRAAVLLLEDGTMRFRAWRGLSETYRRAVEGHSSWAPDVVDPEPVVVADATADPALGPLRDVVLAEGIRALAFVPVVYRGRLVGTFMVYRDAPGALGADDLEFVQAVARHVAVAAERRRAERERETLLARAQAARAEAEAANRAKDEFLAVLSHELRTPMNAILGWARILSSAELDPETSSRAVQAILRGALNQTQLIDDLLDVSRITEGKLNLDLGHVALDVVVETAVESVRPLAVAKDLQLQTALRSASPPIVLGDSQRLQQVVGNLLANAIKFTDAGGRIAVGVVADETSAVVTVADTGKGIAPALLPHVFDRFRQADTSTTRAHAGLGLGLAIVRHLVQLHGGTVRAESDGEGRGATFVVELPLAARIEPAPTPLAASGHGM
jgi:signal transduction histidine kinase